MSRAIRHDASFSIAGIGPSANVTRSIRDTSLRSCCFAIPRRTVRKTRWPGFGARADVRGLGHSSPMNAPREVTDRSSITVFQMAVMTTIAVASLRSLPAMAVYGWASILLWLIPALLFLCADVFGCGRAIGIGSWRRIRMDQRGTWPTLGLGGRVGAMGAQCRLVSGAIGDDCRCRRLLCQCELAS